MSCAFSVFDLSTKFRIQHSPLENGRYKLSAAAVFLKLPEMRIVEFANSKDFDKRTHNESPYLDIGLHSLSSLKFDYDIA